MIFQLLICQGVVLAFVALVVRFAGNKHILAGSKQSGITDVAKLNKWAGNRFLILPVIAFAMAKLSLTSVAAGIAGFMLLLVVVVAVIVWISVGSKKL